MKSVIFLSAFLLLYPVFGDANDSILISICCGENDGPSLVKNAQISLLCQDICTPEVRNGNSLVLTATKKPKKPKPPPTGIFEHRPEPPELEAYRLFNERFREALEAERELAESMRSDGGLKPAEYIRFIGEYRKGISAYRTNMQEYKRNTRILTNNLGSQKVQ